MKVMKRMMALLIASAMISIPVLAEEVAWSQTNGDPINWYYGDENSDVIVGAESPTEAPIITPAPGEDLVKFYIKHSGKSYKVIDKDKNAVKLYNIKKTSKKLTVVDKVTYKGTEYDVAAVGKNVVKRAKDLRRIYFESVNKVALGNGLFDGVDTEDMTIYFNEKIDEGVFAKMVRRLKNLGYTGDIKLTSFVG